jgi:hypothetical protein
MSDQDIHTYKGAVIKEYAAIAELVLTEGTENRSEKALLQGHFIHHNSHMKPLGAEPQLLPCIIASANSTNPKH